MFFFLDGILDPEERITLVVKSMQDIREEWLKVKARIQTRDRKERRRKRKMREKGFYSSILYYKKLFLIRKM
jgi:hypothetical protein